MQPSWFSFSSWPHNDTTSLGCSVTCTFLSSLFYTRDVFGVVHFTSLDTEPILTGLYH